MLAWISVPISRSRPSPAAGPPSRPHWLLLALFTLAAIWINLATPLYEAPDEWAHFAYAVALRQTGRLPVIPDDLPRISHEIGQPPLYYGLIALAITPFDLSDFPTVAPANPYWREGGGRVVHYHSRAENLPAAGTALAVRAARLVSTLLGLATIVFTHRLAGLILPRAAGIAAALVAFNPQFAFMSATITNDALITALAAAVLFAAARLLLNPTSRPAAFVALGVLTGLAALAKPGGLGLVVIAAWVILVPLALHAGISLSRAMGHGLLAAAGFALTAGWWFWRSTLLYGDPLAWQALLLANAPLIRPQPLSWPAAIAYSLPLKRSFWMAFAYGIFGPESFYRVVDGIVLLGLAGLAAGFYRRLWSGAAGRVLLLLGAWIVLYYGLLLRWIRVAEASNQGRLLFPALPALAILLAAGFVTYGRWRPFIATPALTFLGAWTLAAPLILIGPYFAWPPALEHSDPRRGLEEARFGDQMALHAVSLETRRWEPGREVNFDLFWQALEPIGESHVLALRILDSENRVVATVDRLPAAGRFPTPMWVLGEIFRESHRLPPIAPDAAPGLARLILIVYPFARQDQPLPVTRGGVPVPPPLVLAEGVIPDLGAGQPEEAAPLAVFGSIGRLVDAQISPAEQGRIDLTLTWQALAGDGRSYQVFVHLLDDSGELVAQADGPPQGGRYPTSIWTAGDWIVDPRQIQLPAGQQPGRYLLFAGLYHLDDGVRAAAAAADGTPLAGDQVFLGAIEIE